MDRYGGNQYGGGGGNAYGAPDRARLGGWRDLMNEWRLPVPGAVNQQLQRRTGYGSGFGNAPAWAHPGVRDGDNRWGRYGDRGDPNWAQYQARLKSAYGGEVPQNAPHQMYRNYVRGNEYAANPNRFNPGGNGNRFAIAPTIGNTGVPNVVPAGARLYYPPKPRGMYGGNG